MQQSVVISHTSDIVGNRSTAMHSRYSVTLTAEKTDMRRQTQTDRSSERSSAVHPEFIKAVQPSVATSLMKSALADSSIISSNTSEEEQEQSATKYNNAAKSNNYRIMHMSNEDKMDKALELQLSVNEASDQVTKISKSYLVEQRILADGDRGLTSASKRQEDTSSEETKIIIKSVQNNSTANRQRTNDSNQYLYERDTRVTAEERTVVTKLTQLEANRPDESKTMAKLSKQEAKNRTAFTATISKEISLLSNIPAKTTNKNGTDQDEQLKREDPAEEMKEATQEDQNSIQLSINEAYIKSNLYEEESDVKSAIDEREFNILPQQHELKLSEESTMEQDNNQSKAKFTNTEAKNQRDNTRASYLLKDGKPQIQFNSAETKGSNHQACTDESRREESIIQSYERIKKQVSNCKRYHGKLYKQLVAQ